jgi:hypothetical protein
MGYIRKNYEKSARKDPEPILSLDGWLFSSSWALVITNRYSPIEGNIASAYLTRCTQSSIGKHF